MGQAFAGAPQRFASLIWNDQTTLTKAAPAHPAKTLSRPRRINQRLLEHSMSLRGDGMFWIPACAGMTGLVLCFPCAVAIRLQAGPCGERCLCISLLLVRLQAGSYGERCFCLLLLIVRLQAGSYSERCLCLLPIFIQFKRLQEQSYQPSLAGSQVASAGNTASSVSTSSCSTMNGMTPRYRSVVDSCSEATPRR